MIGILLRRIAVAFLAAPNLPWGRSGGVGVRARTAFLALIHHIIVIHYFLLIFNVFRWFWMVFGWFGMDWDGLGPTTTPTTSTSALIPRQGPREGT